MRLRLRRWLSRRLPESFKRRLRGRPVVAGQIAQRPAITARFVGDRPDGITKYLSMLVENSGVDADMTAFAHRARAAGWRVGEFEPRRWSQVPEESELIVVTSPHLHPWQLPAGSRRVAWVRDRPETWAGIDGGGWYDQWWASAEPIAQVLRDGGHARVIVNLAPDVNAVPVAADPLRMGFYPDWRAGNPFLSMLYDRAGHHGFAIAPVANPALSEPTWLLGQSPNRALLHVHWSDAISQGAPDEAEALQRAEKFAQNVASFRASGGRLVWTIHNAMPHDLRFPNAERLVLEVLRTADVIHVMGENTAAACAPYFEYDPAAELLVRHSSFVGWYHDGIAAASARAQLGLPPDRRVAVMLGQLRRYKGADLLLDAMDALGDAAPLLVLAGSPGAGAEVQELLARARGSANVLVHDRRIPDDELATYYKAADFAVLPYRAVLNSGTVLAALGFGTPVIVPALGNIHLGLPADCARVIQANDVQALAAALADPPIGPAARTAARAFAESRLPGAMSDQFFEALGLRLAQS